MPLRQGKLHFGKTNVLQVHDAPPDEFFDGDVRDPHREHQDDEQKHDASAGHADEGLQTGPDVEADKSAAVAEGRIDGQEITQSGHPKGGNHARYIDFKEDNGAEQRDQNGKESGGVAENDPKARCGMRSDDAGVRSRNDQGDSEKDGEA